MVMDAVLVSVLGGPREICLSFNKVCNFRFQNYVFIPQLKPYSVCIWQLRNFFAVKNVHAIVYLFNGAAVPQCENSFLLFAWRFFLQLRLPPWVTLIILGSRGGFPVNEIVCKVCRFFICWYSQVLVDPIYCAKFIVYESQIQSSC